VIDSGASRQMIGEHKKLKTLLREKSSYSVELGDMNWINLTRAGEWRKYSSQQHYIFSRFA